MRVVLLVVLAAILLPGCADDGMDDPIIQQGFDGLATGAAPPGMTIVAGDWGVGPDDGAPSPPNVLYQGSQRYANTYVIASHIVPADLAVDVDVYISEGIDEREAGIVLRYLDSQDHYVFNIDTNEGGARFTRVADGIRDDLFLDRSMQFEVGKWYHLRIEAVDDTFTGYVDGTQVLSVTDGTHDTGRIGLWTKKDTRARFDDLGVFT